MTDLVWLNLLLPIVLGWLVVIERRLARLEGYIEGKRQAKKEMMSE